MTIKQSLLDRINSKIPDSVKELLDVCGNFVAVVTPLGGIAVLISDWITGELSSGESWKNYVIFILAVVIIILFYRFMRQRETIEKQSEEHRRILENLRTTHESELQAAAVEHESKLQAEVAAYESKLQAAAVAHQKERSLASKKYYQLLHDYRNVINDLEFSYKKGTLSDTELTTIVKGFLEDALDYLVDTLNEMTGQTVSGCVKVIIGGNCNRISYRDARVNTFVRSHNSNPARKTLDVRDEQGVPLCKNTDFMEIIAENRNNNDSVFYQPNLKVYEKQLGSIKKKYRNTTPNWEKYYIGTIVAPIRIASKRLFYLDKDGVQEGTGRNKGKKKHSVYYTLGFLCVDSLSEDAFPWEQKENYTYIVKAYAATMFNIMSKNQFYLKRLHENK